MKTLVNFVQFSLQNSNSYFQTNKDGKTYDLDSYLEKIRMFQELQMLGINICKSNKTLALTALKSLRMEEDKLVEIIQSGGDDNAREVQKSIINEAVELLMEIGQIRDEFEPFTGELKTPLITMVNMKQVIDNETEEITYLRSKRVYKERDITTYRDLMELIKFHNDKRNARIKEEIKVARAEARVEAREAKKLQNKSDNFTEKVMEKKRVTV